MRPEVAGQVLAGLARCPHCGIASPQMNLKASTGTQPVQGADLSWRAFIWHIYCCSTCGGGVLASVQQGSFLVDEIYPAGREAHQDIPAPARHFLQQAIDTLHAPDAAAVMAGSAVDAMLKKLGLTEGTLYSRIDQAVENHTITEAMGQWAHEVRLGSNRPRHADEERPYVSAAEAKQSVQFAEALGYFLFVLSARIERGTEEAKEASASK